MSYTNYAIVLKPACNRIVAHESSSIHFVQHDTEAYGMKRYGIELVRPTSWTIKHNIDM